MSWTPTDDIFQKAEDAVIAVRDSYPRRPDDAPSPEVVHAVLAAVGPMIASQALRDAADRAITMEHLNGYPSRAVPVATLLDLAAMTQKETGR